MTPGCRRRFPALRGALEESGLDQEGLVHVFDGPRVLSIRNRQGLYPDRPPPEIFDNDLQDLPAFAVHLGDMVPDGELRHYAAFFRQIRPRLHIPLLAVPGNHEYNKDGRALYREIFGPPAYAFPLHDAYFIMVDNAERTLPPRRSRAGFRKS